MPRRSFYNRRRPSRRTLLIRAPRRGTVIVAAALYILGLFSVLGFLSIPESYATGALAVSGGLLLLSALLRGL